MPELINVSNLTWQKCTFNYSKIWATHTPIHKNLYISIILHLFFIINHSFLSFCIFLSFLLAFFVFHFLVLFSCLFFVTNLVSFPIQYFYIFLFLPHSLFFLKMSHPRPLFRFLFLSFQTNIIIFTAYICEKCPSSILCWDSNPQPSDHESSPITIITGHPPFFVLCSLYFSLTISLSLSDNLSLYLSVSPMSFLSHRWVSKRNKKVNEAAECCRQKQSNFWQNFFLHLFFSDKRPL